MECLGCRIANGIEPNLHIIYENELIMCVLDIAPFNEGHTLILPKKHYWDVEEIDSITSYAIMDASKRLSVALKGLLKPDGAEQRLGQTKDALLKELNKDIMI